MVYKHFNVALVWRWFLMLGLALSMGLLWGFHVRWEWMVVLTIALIISSYDFFQFSNQTHRKIHYLIQAAKNEDSSIFFKTNGSGRVLNELHNSLNELNQIIKEKNIRNRMNERYFSEILLHIGIAIVVFNEKGFVVNTNQAALRLFGLHTFTHLKQLDKANTGLRQICEQISTYNGKSVLLKKGGETVQLSVRSSVIQLRDETITLATFQDIRGELESKELDSWVKLIKVLNHEIMNSLAPVTSIAQSLGSAWQERNGEQPDPLLIDQTVNGLNVIGDRGHALMRFVESYRMFTRMPELKLVDIGMHSFFDRLRILTSPMKEDHDVEIQFESCADDFTVRMDEQLMVQVIINLIKNAIQAMEGVKRPRVEISCESVPGQNAEIRVVDNGKGIPDEIKDEIFIPFFTTRPEGTGIGLSYSRQILIAHGGSISFRSSRDGSVFLVRW
jgi:two-component system, NtrC family, nitrogen regulation sensor histidine kinase NtrY